MEIGCQEKRCPKDDSAPLFEFSEVENAREFASRISASMPFFEFSEGPSETEPSGSTANRLSNRYARSRRASSSP
jgi:hypothetical protein